jgi:hypothetical protein
LGASFPGRALGLLLIAVPWFAAPASAQQRSGAQIWSAKVRELERELVRLECVDVIDEGQHIDMRYLTTEQIDGCEQVVIEEILADDEVYVEHLWCLALWSDLNAARARARGAGDVESMLEEVLDPTPDSPGKVLRRVTTALDIAAAAGAVIGQDTWNGSADGFAAEAERYRFYYFQRRSALDGMRKRWEHRQTIQPDCPPKKRPRSVPTPVEPPAPKPKPKPKPLPVVEGRQLFRCDTDRTDAALGHLVYCTEYDSDRIGSLPTPSQLSMSESICRQSGGVWSKGPCREGWRQRCVTKKGAAHFYYQFVEGAPEQQCRQWKGELTTP